MKMSPLIHRVLTLLVVVTLPVMSFSKTYTVRLDEVGKCLKTAQAGDRILITDGTYTDVALKWKGLAIASKPMVIEAQHPGNVVITGRSSLQLAGEYLTVRGLYFKDGQPLRKTVVDFVLNGQVANHCRLTECVIENFNAPRRDVISSYVILSGRHNRVDHCSFMDKCNLGVTLIVNLNGENCLENYHQIDHNYFGKRDVYGSNGAETMRIGTSQQSYFSSNTLVEDNLFERCSGEVEVISVKSSDNIIRHNTLLECEGVVALRHGKRNLVEENLFLGHGRRNTGGVRIVDADHQVLRNTFDGLAGDRFFSALGVMDAVPNSLPNRYVLVKDVTISGNTFVDCASLEIGTGMDPERTEAPRNVTFADNRIINRTLAEPLRMLDPQAQMIYKGNQVQLAAPYSAEGFVTTPLRLPALPTDKEMRKGKGASWFAGNHVPTSDVRQSPSMITCQPSDDIVTTVNTAPSGSTILLTGKEYKITQTILIDKPLTIQGMDDTQKTTIKFVGDSPACMMTIADGGSLSVKNIVFDGVLEPGKRLAEAGIATAENMIRTYRLKVDGCVFRNFNESGFSAIRGTKATFADSVVIRNSLFYDISGNGIDYSAEKDDKGRYNVDDVIIENCTFRRFLGIPVNIYRGGSDESTAGPYVSVKGCTFEDCCNRQRGSVMRLIGPQLLEVSHCQFLGSGRGGASIRLDEAIWERITIHHCTFDNSGRIMMSTDRVITHDNTFQ